MKIRDAHILPLAFPVILFLNLPVGWLFVKEILPDVSGTPDAVFSNALFVLKERPRTLIYLVLELAAVYVIPLIFSWLVSKWLHENWKRESLSKDLKRIYGNKKSKKLSPKRRPFQAFASRIVDEHILNELSKLTAYSPVLEELMVDIRTDDGFLFNGKFSDFHDEEKKFSGISITNILRFNRCDGELSQVSENDDEPNGKRIYLFPNNGKMFFPREKIQDVHFWRIPRRFKFHRPLETQKDAKIIAWWLSLQWAMPEMKISVKTTVKEQLDPKATDELFFQLERFKLTPKMVTLDVETETSTKPPQENK